MRGDKIADMTASWTLNENAVRPLDILLPATTNDEHPTIVVAIKNASAVVDLAASISNMISFDGAAEPSQLVAGTDFTIPAATAHSKVITGMLPGVPARISLAKSNPTAPAFSAYLVARKA